MAAIDAANYDEITLESSNGKTVDLRLGVLSFDYFEDLFSPTITAKMVVINTGGTVVGEGDKYQSIYNGLPLRGGERVRLKISPSGSNNVPLDFASKISDYFYVSSIFNVLKSGQKEMFTLELVPREAISNEAVCVHKKFPRDQRISDSVRGIIKDFLKSDKIDTIDETQNQYGFFGNYRKPFRLLVWLASKAVPATKDAFAGFFFYQTKDGFSFRSVDSLISEGIDAPKAVYQEGLGPGEDLKILNYSIERNHDLIKKMRIGTYSSFFMQFNPFTGKFTKESQGKFTLNDYASKTKNLGAEPEVPNIVNESSFTLSNTPTRIITAVANIGTIDSNSSSTPNASVELYQRQALLRYNLLFMQSLNITVPLNSNLKVGDVIECRFTKTTNSDPGFESGLYMIKELRHTFTKDLSLTSMKLIRDTYGEFGTK